MILHPKHTWQIESGAQSSDTVGRGLGKILSWPTSKHAKGFTLLELILVMLVLASVMAFAAPSLSRFFRGNTLDSECKRILALTQLARSEAISQGVPMEVWFDDTEQRYGMRERGSSSFEGPPPQGVSRRFQYQVREPYQLVIDRISPAGTPSQAAILFHPDGTLDPSNPPGLLIVHPTDQDLRIQLTLNRYRTGYEIRKGQTMRNPSAGIR